MCFLLLYGSAPGAGHGSGPIGGHTLKANLAVLVLLVVAAFSTSAQQTTRMAASQSTAEPDVQFIQNLIAEYASAADHADAALASQIWSHSPDASFIYPEGHAHGVAETTDDVYRHAMGDTFSQRKLTIHSPSIHVYGDTAWSEFYWDFHANFRSSGAPFESKGRETQIYQKQEGHWFIIHVHYSGMPAAVLGLKEREFIEHLCQILLGRVVIFPMSLYSKIAEDRHLYSHS